MSHQSVVCIATTLSQADTIVERLKVAGFTHNEISLLFPEKTGRRDSAVDRETKVLSGAAGNAGPPEVASSSLGWLVGLGPVTVPDAGTFLAGGPIKAALNRRGFGGIAGALVGMGVPGYQAQRLEGQVRAGGIFISVHTDDPDEADFTKGIFGRSSAQDINISGGSTAELAMESPSRVCH